MATVLNVTEILKRSDGTEIKISGDSKFYAQNNYANLILLDIEDGGSLEACALINFTQQTRQSFTSHNFFMKPVGIVTRVVNEEVITAYQYAIQVPKLVLQNNTKNVIETELTATISSGSNYKGYFSTLVSLNTSIPPTETLKNDLSIAYVVELEKFMQVDYNSLTMVYEWVEVDYVDMFLTQKQYSLSSIYIQPGYSSPQGIAPISVSNTQVIMNILNDLEILYDSLNNDFYLHINDLNNPHQVKAIQVPFDNTGTQLVSTNTEGAIKEVNTNERNTKSIVDGLEVEVADIKDNILEIESDVDDLETEIGNIKDGTLVVKKAEQDQLGNVINTTYETKIDATSKKAEIDGRLDTAERDIDNLQFDVLENTGNITDLQTNKVPKTTKIIGLDLQDDILLTEFKTALGNATQSVAGLLSAEDKTHLDGLVALLESSDGNNVVDTIGEILEIFQNYPEGADLVTVLNGKVDKEAGKGLSQNDFTDALKNKLDGLLNGSQYYDKTYIDALKDQNGWKSQLLTLTPLAPSGMIATATLLLYNTLKLQVKNTATSFVDTDSVEVSLGVVTGNKIQLSDTSVYLEIGATNSTFVAPTGWELQIVGLKYTELKAVDTTYDNTVSEMTATTVQGAIDELDTQVELKVSTSDIVDNLTSTDTDKPLSANQGKVLNDTKENLSNKATNFDVVNDTLYPTTKAVAERLLNLPITELNNHTLREVFEDGNLVTPDNINKPIVYGDNTRYYVNQITQSVNITVNNHYYETSTFNVKSPTPSIRTETLFQHNIGGANRQVSVVNHGSKEFLNNYRQSAKWENIWQSGSFPLTKVAEVRPTSLFFDVDDYLQTTNNYLIDLTSLGISSLTVKQIDYWFNLYQTLTTTNDANAIFNLFAPKQQEAWLTPTLTGATSTYIRYRKDTLGTVIVEGNITVTTIGTNLTLPVGYRPLFAYTVGILTFNTDGTVVSSATGTQTLSVRYTGA